MAYLSASCAFMNAFRPTSHGRHFHQTLHLATCILSLAVALRAASPEPAAAGPKAAPKYNVLILMADDARPWLGCYGDPEVKTPNIDRFSAKAVRFDQAFCQYPVCNPSRTSMLTGRYPNKTRMITNGIHHFRDIHPDWVTLPQYFKDHGYATINAGKLFHGRAQDLESWTEWIADQVPASARKGNEPISDVDESGTVAAQPRFRVLEGNGESGVDYWIADNGIKLLQKYRDQPFLLAVGFHAPHASPTAAKRFYDLYPLETRKLPPDFATKPTVPAGCPDFMLPKTNDVFYMKIENTPEEAKEVIRGYQAATSNVDWNIGRVLDELERLGLAEKTIVIVTSDHGYHNGEKGRWGKTSAFDVSLRVPLLVYVPGGGARGQASARTVELLDLYPTLADLCGLPPPAGVQGQSFSALLQDPAMDWPHAAFSMARTGGPIGYTVRTERYRYAEWGHGQQGAALFDHTLDPNETVNLVTKPELAPIVAEMRDRLKTAFEDDMPAQIPAVDPVYVPQHLQKKKPAPAGN